MNPSLYTGRPPENYREMISLYSRYADGEILLSPDIISACLKIQERIIERGTLKEERVMVRGMFR